MSRSIVRAGCKCSSIADLVESTTRLDREAHEVRIAESGRRLADRSHLSSRPAGDRHVRRSSTSRRSRPRPRPSNPSRPAGGRASHLPAPPGIAGQSVRTASTHSSGVVGQEAGLARLDHLDVAADRVGDDRQPGRLILEDLQPAFPAAPEVVGQPAHADLSGREVARFGLLVPGDGNRPGMRKASGNRSQMTRSLRSGNLSPQPLPDRPLAAPGPGACSTSRSRRGRRCWPLCRACLMARSGSCRDPRRWESRGRVRPAPRRAEHNRPGSRCRRRPCRPLGRSREPPHAARRTVRTALVVGIAEEDGVVEIEDEVPRVPAQNAQAAMPARVYVAGSPRRTAAASAKLDDPGRGPSLEPLARRATSPHRSRAGSKARIRYRQQTWSGDSTRASSFIPSSVTVGGHPRRSRGCSPIVSQDHNRRPEISKSDWPKPRADPPIRKSKSDCRESSGSWSQFRPCAQLGLPPGPIVVEIPAPMIRSAPDAPTWHGSSLGHPVRGPRSIMKNFVRLVRFAWPHDSVRPLHRLRGDGGPACSSPSSGGLPLLHILFDSQNPQRWISEKIDRHRGRIFVVLDAQAEKFDASRQLAQLARLVDRTGSRQHYREPRRRSSTESRNDFGNTSGSSICRTCKSVNPSQSVEAGPAEIDDLQRQQRDGRGTHQGAEPGQLVLLKEGDARVPAHRVGARSKDEIRANERLAGALPVGSSPSSTATYRPTASGPCSS